jgi:hypothetical protein
MWRSKSTRMRLDQKIFSLFDADVVLSSHWAFEHPWIDHEDVAGGGTLELHTGPSPSDWGR